MKIRMGFVSNSSSSSFIVGIKGDANFTKEDIAKVLNVPTDSVLHKFADDIAEFIFNKGEEVTRESVVNNYDVDFDQAIHDGIAEAGLLQRGYKVYTIDCSYNESGDPIELLIGNGGLDDVDTDSVVFRTIC